MASQPLQSPPLRPWLRLRSSFPSHPNPVASAPPSSTPVVPSPHLPPFPKTFTYRPFTAATPAPPPPPSLLPILLSPPGAAPIPPAVPELPPLPPVETAPPDITPLESQEVKQPPSPSDPIPNPPDLSLLPSLAPPIPEESEKLHPPSLSRIHVIEDDRRSPRAGDLKSPPSLPPPPLVSPARDLIPEPIEEEQTPLLNIITMTPASPLLKELEFSSSPFQPSVVAAREKTKDSTPPKPAFPVKDPPSPSPPFPSPMIDTGRTSAPPSPEMKHESQDSSSAPPPSPLSLPPPLPAPQIHPKTRLEGDAGEKRDASRVAQMKPKEKKSVWWEGYLEGGVIRMGGENIGAVMETGRQQKQQQERGGGRTRALANSNVQGVNNSVLYNSWCVMNDPGVKIKFKRKGRRVLHSDSDCI